MAEQRFSELSALRQDFIRRCQRLGFGKIVGLAVRDREPVFDEHTEVFVDLKLDRREAPRSEQDLSDFVLSDEVDLLFSTLDAIRDGTVEQVEVRAGVPRRMVFKDSDPTHG
jgi:hypothetical protein